jgi:predicted HicB family RNase H-like nuclease
MGEFWDEMPEVHFDVDIKSKRYLISVDESLMSKLSEIAKLQQVSLEDLVNLWLKEKVLEVS